MGGEDFQERRGSWDITLVRAGLQGIIIIGAGAGATIAVAVWTMLVLVARCHCDCIGHCAFTATSHMPVVLYWTVLYTVLYMHRCLFVPRCSTLRGIAIIVIVSGTTYLLCEERNG